MGSLKKLYGWYPDGDEWIPIKVDSNGKVVISNLTVTFIGVTVFLNSWVNFGAGYETAGYCKDSFGFGHIKGVIKSGTSNTACFQLPVGYRPALAQLVPCVSNGLFGYADVGVNGNVVVYGSSVWISFADVSFYVG